MAILDAKKTSRVVTLDIKEIRIFSRDEKKQHDMRVLYNNPKIKFYIGDVRDEGSLRDAMIGVDYVFHAAALKQVPSCEFYPIEAVNTNVLGTENVFNAAIANNIAKVVCLSTDKAVYPINAMGMTKAMAEKILQAKSRTQSKNETILCITRYGNVMGSRGSVIPFFLSIANKGNLPITDNRMTRFMITLEQAVELVWHAFNDMEGGEIYVKKIPSMNILDIAKSVNKSAVIRIIGIRPGEKIHEQMIGIEDAPNTYEYKDHYKILPMIHDWSNDKSRIKGGVKVSSDFTYSSDNNEEWMTIDELSFWIDENKFKIGLI